MKIAGSKYFPRSIFRVITILIAIFCIFTHMDGNLLFSVLMPIGMGIIMLGLGLSLKREDFAVLWLRPKPILTGLFIQLLVLPLICFLIVIQSGLRPELAVGFMLLASAPGGPSSNLFSHLSGGDVALNVSLTAINSILSIFFMPLLVNLSIQYFAQDGEAIPLQFRKIIEVFLIVLIPIVVGMTINKRKPNWAIKMHKTVKIVSATFLAILIIAAVISQGHLLSDYIYNVGINALLFNVISLLIGFTAPYLMKLGKRQAMAISMEIGIHNGTLAIYVAIHVMGSAMIAIPAAIYSIMMYFTATAFSMFLVHYFNHEAMIKD